MKTLFFAPILFLALLLTNSPANAAGPEGNEAAARLEYRFFENQAKKNVFTLALERNQTAPATIRIFTQDGSAVYKGSLDEAKLVRHFDLRPLEAGTYTLQIKSGSLVREQAIVVQ